MHPLRGNYISMPEQPRNADITSAVNLCRVILLVLPGLFLGRVSKKGPGSAPCGPAMAQEEQTGIDAQEVPHEHEAAILS